MSDSIAGVYFDFYGTLIDSKYSLTHVWSRIAKRLGTEIKSDDPRIWQGVLEQWKFYDEKDYHNNKPTEEQKAELDKIVLDAMGVIFIEGRDLFELLIPFAQKRDPNLSSELIQNTYFEASLGKITSQEVWKVLGFANEYPEIEKEYLDTCLTIDPDFIKVAEELRNKYSMALLSNDVKEWSSYLRQKYNLNPIFNEIIRKAY